MADGKPNASKEKAEFILLGILAILFLALGLASISHRLRAPFALKQEKNISASAETTLEALKTKDTDKDGLSDYDEQFLYNTSPYITDSDSDGISDAEEVKTGADPNCPKGKTCRVEEEFGATSSTPPAVPNFGTIDFESVTAGLGEGKEVTAAVLRAALREAGVDKTILDAADDATLLKLYQETAKEQQ